MDGLVGIPSLANLERLKRFLPVRTNPWDVDIIAGMKGKQGKLTVEVELYEPISLHSHSPLADSRSRRLIDLDALCVTFDCSPRHAFRASCCKKVVSSCMTGFSAPFDSDVLRLIRGGQPTAKSSSPPKFPPSVRIATRIACRFA